LKWSEVIAVISGRSEPHRSHTAISNHGRNLAPQTPGIPSSNSLNGPTAENTAEKYTLHVLYVHTYIRIHIHLRSTRVNNNATVLHKSKLHPRFVVDVQLVNWRPGCASLTHHHKSQFKYRFHPMLPLHTPTEKRQELESKRKERKKGKASPPHRTSTYAEIKLP